MSVSLKSMSTAQTPVFLRPDIDWRARAAWRRLSKALAEVPPGTVPCRAAADPGSWTSDRPEDAATAAEACAGCPLLRACRTYARSSHEAGGVWGGETPAQRMNLYTKNTGKGVAS